MRLVVPFRVDIPSRFGSFARDGDVLTLNGATPHVPACAPDGTPWPCLPPAARWDVRVRVAGEPAAVPWGAVRLLAPSALREESVSSRTVKEGPGAAGKIARLGVMMTTGLPIGLGGKKVEKRVKEGELVIGLDVFTGGERWRFGAGAVDARVALLRGRDRLLPARLDARQLELLAEDLRELAELDVHLEDVLARLLSGRASRAGWRSLPRRIWAHPGIVEQTTPAHWIWPARRIAHLMRTLRG